MQCLFVAWRKFYCISVGQSNGGGGGGNDEYICFCFFFSFFFPALSSNKLVINWSGSKTFLVLKAEAI